MQSETIFLFFIRDGKIQNLPFVSRKKPAQRKFEKFIIGSKIRKIRSKIRQHEQLQNIIQEKIFFYFLITGSGEHLPSRGNLQYHLYGFHCYSFVFHLFINEMNFSSSSLLKNSSFFVLFER